jgi:pimeloyl-ACP methyl ester carboxylesterase
VGRARVGCSFATRFPERTAGLALIDGGYVDPGDVGADFTADLATCVAEARQEIEEDSFASWDAYFAFERESLKRWTPALEAAHRAAMRETKGRVVPISNPRPSARSNTEAAESRRRTPTRWLRRPASRCCC